MNMIIISQTIVSLFQVPHKNKHQLPTSQFFQEPFRIYPSLSPSVNKKQLQFFNCSILNRQYSQLKISMTIYIDPSFISKYKSQFYTKHFSTEQLLSEQDQLFNILDDLHDKTQKYFQQMCMKAQLKDYTQRFKPDNTTPHKLEITEAELKNQSYYRHLLENEKYKLQERINKTIELNGIDIDQEINQQKQKVNTLIKENKKQYILIKKLGNKLVQDAKTPKQIYCDLYEQIQMKKIDNCNKYQKILNNNSTILELTNKMQLIQHETTKNQHLKTELQSTELKDNLQTKWEILQKNKSMLKQNIKSLKKKLSQQYYYKLKKLQNIKTTNEKLDKEVQSMEQKIDESRKQLKDN